MNAGKNPPAGTFYYEAASLLVWRPEPVIDEAAVNRLIAYLGELEIQRAAPFNRFIDTRQAEAVELNFRYIFHISLYRRLSYRGPNVLTAVLVHDDAIARYFKLHEILTQGSAIDVRVFKESALAAEWLGVPVALLDNGEGSSGTT